MKIIQRHFEVIASTNTWAKQNALHFDKNAITLITAACQTQGRGRFNRRWESPAHQNLYATFCFFLEDYSKASNPFSLFFSLLVSYAVEEFNLRPKIKWPNDLLINGKKCAGILCETVRTESQIAVLAGIGININMTQQDLQKVSQPATSLWMETGRSYDIALISEKLKELLLKHLPIFLSFGFSTYYQAYRDRLDFIKDHPMNATIGSDKINFLFKELNIDGSITVQLQDRSLKTLYSAEIADAIG